MADGRLPILILVGGPVGAGKTTLARTLADRLGLVHVCRDSVKSTIAASEADLSPEGEPVIDAAKAGIGGEFGQRAFVTTYAATHALVDGGASVVIDQAWRTGRSESELQRLISRSRAVLLIAAVSPTIARDRARSRGHRRGLPPLDDVLAAADDERQAFLSFDIGVPRLIVDTTSGYDPSLDEIERWIWLQATP